MPKVLGVKDGSQSSNRSLAKIGSVDIARKRASKTYYVLSDDTTQAEDTITSTSGIPQMYAVVDGGYVVGHPAREVQTVIHPSTGILATLWEVTIETDSHFDPAQQGQDPFLVTPIVDWDGETEEEVLESDAVTGEAVVNDNGEQILITTPVILPVLIVKRLETYPFDPTIILEYVYHTNSATFYGAPPGSALMKPIRVQQTSINYNGATIKACSVEYQIAFKIKPGVDEPWKARVLHQGKLYRPTAPDDPIPYVDPSTGQARTVNLASGGTKLPEANDPVYKEFNRFRKNNLNTLGLGPFF